MDLTPDTDMAIAKYYRISVGGLGVSPEILRYFAARQKAKAELLTVVPEPGEILHRIFVIPEDSRRSFPRTTTW